MNHTIQNHLDGRRIEQRPALDEEVQGFWSKALTAYADAMNPSSSVENRLLRAYDAARIVALAIVREAGYRMRGAESHHYVTFDVARSVVAEPDLRRALARMDGLRKVRHAVEYEAEDEVDEPLMEDACRIAEQVLRLGADYIQAARPAIAKDIAKPDLTG